MHIFSLDNLKGRDQSEDLNVDGKIILECRYMCLRIEISAGL